MSSTVEHVPAHDGARLTVRVLPARQGDCVLVEWSHEGRTHRLLVDAGPAPAYRDLAAHLARLDVRAVDALVLTHIDADHIEGAILLLNDADLQLAPDDVWYNGARHLTDQLGPAHGEIFGALLTERGLGWNDAFAGGAVVTRETSRLPTTRLHGGVDVTVLAPGEVALRRLRDEWARVWEDAGLTMGDPEDALAALRARPTLSPLHSYLAGEELPDVARLSRVRTAADRSVSNASSIVLLVESADQRVLLAGDSTPAVLLPAVQRLLAERGLETLPLSDFKLPHHGSAKNLSAELVRLLPADRYLVSSDGSFFHHPDDTALAQILELGPPGLELVFNYDTPRNRRWDAEALRETYGHQVSFPAPADQDQG